MCRANDYEWIGWTWWIIHYFPSFCGVHIFSRWTYFLEFPIFCNKGFNNGKIKSVGTFSVNMWAYISIRISDWKQSRDKKFLYNEWSSFIWSSFVYENFIKRICYIFIRFLFIVSSTTTCDITFNWVFYLVRIILFLLLCECIIRYVLDINYNTSWKLYITRIGSSMLIAASIHFRKLGLADDEDRGRRAQPSPLQDAQPARSDSIHQSLHCTSLAARTNAFDLLVCFIK